jgi:hypothetical protein
VKRSGKDEPMWVAIHMCEEAPLEVSLYSYLYVKLEKSYTFITVFYIFSPMKSENKGRIRSAWKWGRRGRVTGGEKR